MAGIEASGAWEVAAVGEVEGYSILESTLDNKPWDIPEGRGVVGLPEEEQVPLLEVEGASPWVAEEEEHSTQPVDTEQGMVRPGLVKLEAFLLLERL